MEDDTQRLAAEREARLKGWLDNFEQAAEVAPHVRRAYDVAKWESEVVSQAPATTKVVIARDLLPYYSNSLATLSGALPDMPQYAPNNVVPNLVATTASGTVTYNLLTSFRSSDDPSTQRWVNNYAPVYETIQVSFSLVERINALLISLNGDIAQEFKVAESSYQAAVGGWQDTTAAAIAMRNVLEHYKGELFKRAINRPREQRIRWSDMADRLTITSVGSPGHQQLITQEVTWNDLQSGLSNLAKNQSYRHKRLEIVHTELLDHLYTVLSLVKI